MKLPGSAKIRAAIAPLSSTEKKVLGGMIVVMIRNHDRIKDEEWVAENFTRLTVGALGLLAVRAVDEDIEEVSKFVEKSMGPVLNVAFPLFAQVAADMRQKTGGDPFTLEEACDQALSYFGDHA